jgi:hypothetical protein
VKHCAASSPPPRSTPGRLLALVLVLDPDLPPRTRTSAFSSRPLSPAPSHIFCGCTLPHFLFSPRFSARSSREP